jgi:hypothetical protein
MKLLTQAKTASVKPLVIGLLTAIGALYTAEAAEAGELRSTLKEIAVFGNRVHCLCTTSKKDGSEDVKFLAVSTADAKLADRMLTVATTALISGRKFIGGFNDGDTSGTTFGCAAGCRKLTYFGIE